MRPAAQRPQKISVPQDFARLPENRWVKHCFPRLVRQVPVQRSAVAKAAREVHPVEVGIRGCASCGFKGINGTGISRERLHARSFDCSSYMHSNSAILIRNLILRR